MEIHEKNYIHHDLHSGNIFSYSTIWSEIGDLGLCQQVVDKKDNKNKILIFSFYHLYMEFVCEIFLNRFLLI